MDWYIVVLFLTLALLAPRWGTDSRDGRDWGRAMCL